MPRFMVEIRHDPGRCLHTFHEMIDFDRRLLESCSTDAPGSTSFTTIRGPGR